MNKDPYRTPGDPGPTREEKCRGLEAMYWALMATNTVGKTPAELAELTRRIEDVKRRLLATR